MITQLYSRGNNDSKIIFNNTISCYQRPIINYNMNTKTKNKRKSTKEKTYNSNYINKENINLNLINNKKTNFFRIHKKNSGKPSLSKNIAFLCGIINSMNNTNINKKIKNNIKLLLKENKTENKNDIINIDKISRIQKWWKKIYNKKIIKIIKIQKEWKKYMKNKIINEYYFFSFKKLISNSLNNKNKNNNTNINLIKSFKDEEKDIPCIKYNIRKKFIFYITQKLSKFFLLILNKLNLFSFIKILFQRINKSINQYVFYLIIKKKDTPDEKIFFFETIKRQIKVNLNMDKNNFNEISILLRTNIPKFFLDEFNKNYIPYINSIQEKNLINTQLFLYNNENLVNYIIFFLEKENDEKLNDKIKAQYKKYIKNDLNLHKLKNRNIFGLMRYINILEKKYKLNSKLKIRYYKESYHSENIEDDAINNYNDEFENIYENDKEYIMNNNIDIKKFKLKFHFMNDNI